MSYPTCNPKWQDHPKHVFPVYFQARRRRSPSTRIATSASCSSEATPSSSSSRTRWPPNEPPFEHQKYFCLAFFVLNRSYKNKKSVWVTLAASFLFIGHWRWHRSLVPLISASTRRNVRAYTLGPKRWWGVPGQVEAREKPGPDPIKVFQPKVTLDFATPKFLTWNFLTKFLA